VKRALGRLLTVVCLGLMLFAVGALFLPTALGYKRYVITGGSMTGTIDKGSVIYSRLVPTDQLRPGDIITFVPPDIAEPVTHRIKSISLDKYGHRVFVTKGDFNSSEDPWRVRLADAVQARYSFDIPYLGYGLAMLATRQVRMLLIGLPAIVIALSLLWSLWKEAGTELARQEAAARERAVHDDVPHEEAAEPDGAGAVALEWEGPDPFDGRPEAELADLRGWWQ